jgi:ribose/xylose/arabinose/galactoside ABC-type transport system permease subunit
VEDRRVRALLYTLTGIYGVGAGIFVVLGVGAARDGWSDGAVLAVIFVALFGGTAVLCWWMS